MTSRNEEQQALFERSDAVETHDPLVSFFYELMRDHIHPGVVEDILKHSTTLSATLAQLRVNNGWLAQYAQDVVQRLQTQSGEVKDDRERSD